MNRPTLMNLRTSFNNKEALSKLISDMETKRPQSAIKIESERRPLAPDFIPGPYDVICARGKAASSHPGNVRFRQIIQDFKPRYCKAPTKLEKSLLVSDVVEAVRGCSPDGGFVKKFGNQWCEVGDSVAREKIGQCLRDQLHSKYKSSTKAKKEKRRELRALDKDDEEIEKSGSLPVSPVPLPLEPQSSMYSLTMPLPLEPQSSMCFLKDLDLFPVPI